MFRFITILFLIIISFIAGKAFSVESPQEELELPKAICPMRFGKPRSAHKLPHKEINSLLVNKRLQRENPAAYRKMVAALYILNPRIEDQGWEQE